MTDVQIHWFSIINSVVVVFFLAGILSMIMIRTLRRDIARYNKEDEPEEAIEETGWKLVHGDVFRPPKHTNLLVAFLSTGIQLISMSSVIICKPHFSVRHRRQHPFGLRRLSLDFSFCNVGHVVAIVPGRTGDQRILHLRFHGVRLWTFRRDTQASNASLKYF